MVEQVATPEAVERTDASDEHALIRRAMAGQGSAVAVLVRRLMPVIRARVRRSLMRQGKRLGPHDGDDLVQEIWLRLIDDSGRRLLAYDPSRGATLEGYTGLIAEREIGNLRQKAGAKRRGGNLVAVTSDDAKIPSAGASPEQQVEAQDLAARLGEYLEGELPARGRLILRYAFMDGLPPQQVAETLGVKVQVVYNWQHKIRTAARAFLRTTA